MRPNLMSHFQRRSKKLFVMYCHQIRDIYTIMLHLLCLNGSKSEFYPTTDHGGLEGE